jgi:hypothetical protein
MLRARLASVFVHASLVFAWVGCLGPEEAPAIDGPETDELGRLESSLTAAQRRTRAGQIRDAAAANGMTEGWLLAGIADAETGMSHCWSELTWACMGPASADCGGGPVVAGAGDGPCADRQGGLGMFQFDAGTYDDTLRREGSRVLSIAGNVAAAVDFTVNMVIRSAYIAGVDNREQAIAWMNGVRVGNERWDPWVRTVTHYYNGCAPSYSCFASRYARYRDFTVNVRNEMGEDFWVLGHDYAATYVHQTFPLARDPFALLPGQESAGYIELRNTGTAAWRPGHTFLGTTQPRDVSSPLFGPDWVAPNRAATVDRIVAPGETGRFAFTVRAPSTPGDYPQFFNLVEEGVAWFADRGGPRDDLLQVRVTVVPPPTCADGITERWSCQGGDRVRCELGTVVREPCAYGCDASAGEAVCGAAPIDADGDGATSDVDCDDARNDVYPGAIEACEDGVDQDCDGADCGIAIGNDAAIEGDAGVGGYRPGRPLTSGCSAAPGTSGGRWSLLIALGLVVLRFRRGLSSPAPRRE